jgi:hypothetical protein
LVAPLHFRTFPRLNSSFGYTAAIRTILHKCVALTEAVTSTTLRGGHPDTQMLLPPLLALGDCAGSITKHWDPSSQYCKRCEQTDTWNHRLNCCSLPEPCPETPLLQHPQLWEHGWMVESPIRTELLQHCLQLQLPVIPWFPTQAPHYIHAFTDGTAAHASSPQLRLAAGAVWLPHINNAYHTNQ